MSDISGEPRALPLSLRWALLVVFSSILLLTGCGERGEGAQETPTARPGTGDPVTVPTYIPEPEVPVVDLVLLEDEILIGPQPLRAGFPFTVTALIQNRLTVPAEDIPDYRWQDIAIGEHVMRSVESYFKVGSADFDNATVLAKAREFVLSALLLVIIGQRAIEELDIDKVVVVDGGKVDWGVIRALAVQAGIPVDIMRSGLRGFSVMFESRLLVNNGELYMNRNTPALVTLLAVIVPVIFFPEYFAAVCNIAGRCA